MKAILFLLCGSIFGCGVNPTSSRSEDESEGVLGVLEGEQRVALTGVPTTVTLTTDPVLMAMDATQVKVHPYHSLYYTLTNIFRHGGVQLRPSIFEYGRHFKGNYGFQPLPSRKPPFIASADFIFNPGYVKPIQFFKNNYRILNDKPESGDEGKVFFDFYEFAPGNPYRAISHIVAGIDVSRRKILFGRAKASSFYFFNSENEEITEISSVPLTSKKSAYKMDLRIVANTAELFLDSVKVLSYTSPARLNNPLLGLVAIKTNVGFVKASLTHLSSVAESELPFCFVRGGGTFLDSGEGADVEIFSSGRLTSVLSNIASDDKNAFAPIQAGHVKYRVPVKRFRSIAVQVRNGDIFEFCGVSLEAESEAKILSNYRARTENQTFENLASQRGACISDKNFYGRVPKLFAAQTAAHEKVRLARYDKAALLTAALAELDTRLFKVNQPVILQHECLLTGNLENQLWLVLKTIREQKAEFTKQGCQMDGNPLFKDVLPSGKKPVPGLNTKDFNGWPRAVACEYVDQIIWRNELEASRLLQHIKPILLSRFSHQVSMGDQLLYGGVGSYEIKRLLNP